MKKELKDLLEIIIITYNREKYIERTLAQLFADDSPIKNFDITIFDNKSTDRTPVIIAEYQKKFPNLSHIVNNRNIGGNANIAKAFAEAKKDYLWILCDDDYYDWSSWNEVENAIRSGTDLICVSRYLCEGEQKRYSRPDLLVQMTFVPASIYKTSNFTDVTMRNIYDALSLMFAQVIPVAEILEDTSKKLYVVEKQIVENGLCIDDVSAEKDLRTSYVRGTDKKQLLPQTQFMSWLLGFSTVIGILKDRKLASDALKCAINFPDICYSADSFASWISLHYNEPEKLRYFLEIYFASDAQMREELERELLRKIDISKIRKVFPLLSNTSGIKNSFLFYLLKKMFYICNDGKHKLICIFGIRIRIRRKLKR